MLESNTKDTHVSDNTKDTHVSEHNAHRVVYFPGIICL